jgi:hypothetical protein
MAEPRRSQPNGVLQINGLNVYCGRSYALQGVDLTLDHRDLSVVGGSFRALNGRAGVRKRREVKMATECRTVRLCHPRESGDPAVRPRRAGAGWGAAVANPVVVVMLWILAFARMTRVCPSCHPRESRDPGAGPRSAVARLVKTTRPNPVAVVMFWILAFARMTRAFPEIA